MFTLMVDNEIQLCLLQKQDSAKLHQLIQENRDHLRKWLPWTDQMISPLHTDSLIRYWLWQFAEKSGINAGIIFNGNLVGSIALQQIDWQNRIASIGYFLGRRAEGNGIMTRTVRALLNYAFNDLQLNRVEIRCGEHNKKSRSIPERLGFLFEGTIRQGELLHGRYHDILLYSMLGKDWRRRVASA